MENSSTLYRALADILGETNVRSEEPMSAHTTFRIGGPAEYFLTPDNPEALQASLKVLDAAGKKQYIIGNGSNLLVSDEGIRGAVIHLGHGFAEIGAEGEYIRARAGAHLSKIAECARDHSLAGFEFAAGIPGSIGGACMMNAGAYGGEMKDVLYEVTCLDGERNFRTIEAGDMDLGYRHSVFMDNNWIVTEAVIRLEKGAQEDIQARMDDLWNRRQTKQPLEMPSAGSTFKRPEGYFAGKLIMDAGLRGYRVGDAQVSLKHCGFVVNCGHATAEDVRQLIEDIRKRVKERFGVELKPEVRFLGSFKE